MAQRAGGGTSQESLLSHTRQVRRRRTPAKADACSDDLAPPRHPGETPRSLRRGAAEADLVAVGVVVDHLAHAVLVGLPRGGLYSPGADVPDPFIEVVDEHRVPGIAGPPGQL